MQGITFEGVFTGNAANRLTPKPHRPIKSDGSRFLLEGFWHAPDMIWAKAVENLVNKITAGADAAFTYGSIESLLSEAERGYRKIINDKQSRLAEIDLELIAAKHDGEIKYLSDDWCEPRLGSEFNDNFTSRVPQAYQRRSEDYMSSCNKTTIDYPELIKAIDNDEVLKPLTIACTISDELEWQHPNLSKDLQTAIINRLDRRFNELRTIYETKDHSAKLDTIIKKTAEMHWLMANTVLYKRGSAAIADITTKAILDSFNIKTSPYKHSIAPDYEAFLADSKTYCCDYPKFFKEQLRIVAV